MGVFFITFRSVTLAQRGEGLLRKRGIRSQLQRTPRWMEEQGCGYCLKIGEEELEDAVAVLRSGGVQFRRIYRQFGDGRAEEVEL